MQRRSTEADPGAPLPTGTLAMLILQILSHGPLHGYAIAQEIKRASQQVPHVEEGSLFPRCRRCW